MSIRLGWDSLIRVINESKIPELKYSHKIHIELWSFWPISDFLIWPKMPGFTQARYPNGQKKADLHAIDKLGMCLQQNCIQE